MLTASFPNDEALKAYVYTKLSPQIAEGAALIGLIGIGSMVYPQFARPDSDLDLIAIYEGGPEVAPLLSIETVSFDTGRRAVELTGLSQDQFESYVFHCEIAKLYAFVRGYRILHQTNPGVERTCRIAISRYFSDASRALSEIRDIGLSRQLDIMRHLMRDAYNGLRNPRLSGSALLLNLRFSEILKDFIALYWIALLARDASKDAAPISVDPNCPLLQSAALLRVFQGLRGGRIVDGDKYPKDPEVQAAMDRLGEAVVGGVERAFCVMEEIMQETFGGGLLIHDRV